MKSFTLKDPVITCVKNYILNRNLKYSNTETITKYLETSACKYIP